MSERFARRLAEARAYRRTTSSARPRCATSSSCSRSGKNPSEERRPLPRRLRGLVLRRMRVVQDREGARAAGNLCPLHKKPVEKVKEETYFFRLSKYEKARSSSYYETHPSSSSRRRVGTRSSASSKGGSAISACRARASTWGIPVPGNPKHVMYVWFDALANYWTALARRIRSTASGVPNGRVVHVVGKDILRFHAVYWPAFLLAAGLTRSRRAVFAHGFLTSTGRR
jgi:methionyl-tRNA synthetase